MMLIQQQCDDAYYLLPLILMSSKWKHLFAWHPRIYHHSIPTFASIQFFCWKISAFILFVIFFVDKMALLQQWLEEDEDDLLELLCNEIG